MIKILFRLSLSGFKYYYLFMSASFLLVSISAKSQNLEQIGSREALTISGGVSANQTFFHSNLAGSSRDPYAYFLNGNINFSIYGLSVPLSFSYSNQSFAYQQPFNQYGISPSYKWATLHLGFRSMNFSKYSLNGHNFLGAGIDLSPTNKLSVSAMYGRLLKAVEYDSTNERNQPAYRRMGYGLKVGYNFNHTNLDLILFKSEDDVSSIEEPPLETEIKPEENLVMGLNGSSVFLGKIVLNYEYANSIITRDVASENKSVSGGNFYQATDFWIENRNSTDYKHAVKLSSAYKESFYMIGLAYERVDPGYTTHGSYYFNNDFENITVNSSVKFLKNKLALNTNLGAQRNNLEDDNLSSTRRFLGSANLNANLSESLTTNLSYSNFQTFVNIRSAIDKLTETDPTINLDTLNFTQISESINISTNYRLGDSESRKHSFAINASFQKAGDQQSYNEDNAGSQFLNLNGSYNIGLPNQNLNASLLVNYNHNENNNMVNQVIGPGINLSKSFRDNQVSSNFGISYNLSYTDNQKTGNLLNLRLSTNYKLYENHNFNLNAIMVGRENNSSANVNEQPSTILDFTANLTYSYSF